MQRCKVMAEPAGAAALAGLLGASSADLSGDRIVCVVSGGNVDLGLLKLWL